MALLILQERQTTTSIFSFRSKLTINVEVQPKTQIVGVRFMRRLAFSFTLYRLPPAGVTHSHLPALLMQGRGEMAMDNSLRSVVKMQFGFPYDVIIAKLITERDKKDALNEEIWSLYEG
jgi:hypothetical protein